MLGVKEGDDRCLDLLVKRYRRPIVQYIFKRIKNHAVAEELTQNVFLRLYRARETYEPTAKFTSWIFRIANHLALNWVRDNRREMGVLSLSAGLERDPERPIANQEPTAEQALLRQARLDEVRQAIEALPRRQRDAVILQRYRELEYTQIAERLQCSTQTVKALIFRAHHTLRERLAA